MTDAMAHRGPNDRGTYVAPGVALGVRRLSIVDVEGGHQPFANESGDVWAIQNGEIYNHAELRASSSATATLPHAAATPSAAAPLRGVRRRVPERLRGMFGIARLGRAAPPGGARPRPARHQAALLRASCDDLLVFASELKSLLASGLVDPELDYEAIDAYLTLRLRARPAHAARRRVEAAARPQHRRRGRRVRVECFWRYPEPRARPAAESTRSRGASFSPSSRNRSRLRLMSDVPLGAMLSGGLDSSLIVGAHGPEHDASRSRRSRSASRRRSETSSATRAMSPRSSAPSTTSWSSSFGRAVDLDELVWSLDEPLADLSALGFLALCGLARRARHGRALGPGRRRAPRRVREHRTARSSAPGSGCPAPCAARRPPAPLGPRARLGAAARDARRARSRRAPARDERPARPGLRASSCAAPLAESTAARPGAQSSARLDGVADHPAGGERSTSTPSSALVDDMLHYFDRASMAHSLEVRVPFLDHQLVEFCATIPRRAQGPPAAHQAVLKQAARGHRPRPRHRQAQDRLLQRRGRQLVRSPGARRHDYLLGPAAALAELLDPRAVERLVQRHAAGGPAPWTPAALDADARGLAAHLSATRMVAARPHTASASPSPDDRRDDVVVRRRHARQERGGEYPSSLPAACKPRQCVRQPGSSSTRRPRRDRIVGKPSSQEEIDWVSAISLFESGVRDESIVVRAFNVGLARLREPAASSRSWTPTSRSGPATSTHLLHRFVYDPSLGIASGACLELSSGRWRARHVTGDHVWGASRAYRAECLADVSPLEERVGWDGIDVFKATARGWRTATFPDLAFRHHRPEGRRHGRVVRLERPGSCCALHGLPPRLPRLPCAASRPARSIRPRDRGRLAQRSTAARAAVPRPPPTGPAAATAASAGVAGTGSRSSRFTPDAGALSLITPRTVHSSGDESAVDVPSARMIRSRNVTWTKENARRRACRRRSPPSTRSSLPAASRGAMGRVWLSLPSTGAIGETARRGRACRRRRSRAAHPATGREDRSIRDLDDRVRGRDSRSEALAEDGMGLELMPQGWAKRRHATASDLRVLLLRDEAASWRERCLDGSERARRSGVSDNQDEKQTQPQALRRSRPKDEIHEHLHS